MSSIRNAQNINSSRETIDNSRPSGTRFYPRDVANAIPSEVLKEANALFESISAWKFKDHSQSRSK